MSTENFPYLTSLHVNDCYTYRDFEIPIGEGVDKPFRHLILTGKNGSGKTAILQGIDDWARIVRTNTNRSSFLKVDQLARQINSWKATLRVHPDPFYNSSQYYDDSSVIYRLFKSRRKSEVAAVSSVTSDVEFKGRASREGFTNLLKQYLVNKKVNQAFAIIEKRSNIGEEEDKFFDNLESILKSMFEDNGLKLVFVREEYEFYLQHSDNRKVTFNQLSDGFSAFMSIVLELIVRVDMIQTELKNFTLNPSGLILIDEPENHLHLEMQYQVMPLLTRLFPNIQFIVATHSPAVVSSIKDATVFDLTTKEVAKDWVVGSSFSELMQTHFGLDNEFSNIADNIIAEADRITSNGKSPEQKLSALRKLFADNEQYLSPGFHLAIESKIIKLEKQLETA